MTLVFFVEEESMEIVLERLLPRLGVEPARFRIITHQGVSDLERKLPGRLRAWQDPNAAFVILRDNDNGDCIERKGRLLRIGHDAGRRERVHVRIVCQELEAWFLGDPAAVERAGYRGDLKLKAHQDVDAIPKPSRRLQDRLVGYQKTDGARRIAAELDPGANSSTSFNTTIALIRQLAGGA